MKRGSIVSLVLGLVSAAVCTPWLAVAAEPDPAPDREVLGERAPAAPASGAEAPSTDVDLASERVELLPSGVDAHRVELARAHFQRGVSLYRSAAYDAAFAEFMRAHELAPNHRILYNLAQVQAQRHDYVEAVSFFQRYLDEGAESVPAERAEEVRTEIAELERRVSRLRVETNVDDAHLFVNGLAAGDLPRDRPLLLNAGVHRLRVEKAGYVSASRMLTLAGGEESDVSLDLVAELDMDDLAPPLPPPASSPPTTPLAPTPALDRTALWTSLVATGALTGATVTFGLLTRRANATLDDQLSRFPAPRASIEAGRTRVRTFALLTDGFGAAAAAALGLSTYFFFSTDSAPDDSPTNNGLRAQISPSSSGLVWLGAF